MKILITLEPYGIFSTYFNIVQPLVCKMVMGLCRKFFFRQNLVTILHNVKEALAIRRIFSLVDIITKAKFSNSPNDFTIRLFG